MRLLPAILESHAPFDIVVMMLGTNDLKAYCGLTAFDIAKAVQTLTQHILNSDAGLDGAAPADGPIGRFVPRITLRGNVQRTCLV